MKKIFSPSIFLWILLFNSATEFSQSGNWFDNLNIYSMAQPIPASNKFIDPGYYVWCGSVTKGDDARFYMLYARWPLTDGFESWPITSEVAVAVSDNPGVPFKHLKVALPARGTQFWDGAMTHNPHVIKHQGKYYLYYTANSGSGYWDKTDDTLKPRMSHPEWWVNRNNQRVGVAVSDSPYGPWKRFDKPLIDITPYGGIFGKNTNQRRNYKSLKL